MPSIYHLVVVGIALVGAFIAYKLWIWPYFLSPLRSVPGPHYGNLIFGQYPTIAHYEVDTSYREWVNKYGPVVRILGPFGIERLVFMKPEALHHILVKHWADYPRPFFMRHMVGIIAGYGLLTVTGLDHKNMRKTMNPAFATPNLIAQTSSYFPSINSLLNILDSEIDRTSSPDSGKVFPIHELMGKVTLDIISSAAFGYDINSLHNPDNELAKAYERVLSLQSGINFAKLVVLISLPGALQIVGSEWAYRHRHWLSKTEFLRPLSVLIEGMHHIREISAQILCEKFEELGTSIADTDSKRDIMSILVRARMADLVKDSNAYTMSNQAMMDQMLTFLAAGHETTASGLSWTLWLLANDQESQDKLRAEVYPIFEQDAEPDYRSLRDLSWLDCVIMESLRIMPPAPMTVRTALQTGYIDGILVPKGTLLVIPIRVVNTWRAVWGEDAEEFRPSRWLELPKDYDPKYSMLSFLAGPHACIGKTMAIIEMKTIVAAMIAKFSFEPAWEGQAAQPEAAITMRPADGMPLLVKRVRS